MSNSGKTLGIIGGLGPLPTAFLSQMLTLYSDVFKDQEHINILSHSYPSTPDRTAYILGESEESPLPKILSTGRELCKLGVDLIAIPCVTSHYFYSEISSGLTVPVVNMVEETVKEAQRRKITKIGIMATSGTVRTGLFQTAFSQQDIETILPEPDLQRDVMYLIYDCVKAGKPIDMSCFRRVSSSLYERGAQAIVLGCTELSVVNMGEKPQEKTICALSVLAKACLRHLGVPLKTKE